MWPCIVTNFLLIKPTRCTYFSNLFWKWNSTCFGQFLCPVSGVIHCTHSNGMCHTGSFRAAAGSGWNCSSILILLESCQETCMTYTIAECTVNNSWYWTEELPKHVEFHFQNKFEKLVHLVGFIIRKFLRNCCCFHYSWSHCAYFAVLRNCNTVCLIGGPLRNTVSQNLRATHCRVMLSRLLIPLVKHQIWCTVAGILRYAVNLSGHSWTPHF
jgi:hypothetical protein